MRVTASPAEPAPSGSRLVACYETRRRLSLKMRIAGWVCAPVLCVGCCCCLYPAWAVDSCLRKLGGFIELRTAAALHAMAAMVKREQLLFLDACMVVSSEPAFPNMRLLDALRYGRPEIYSAIKLGSTTVLDYSPARRAYTIDVWHEYTRRGGNVAVLLHCLPEFLAMYVSPVDEDMCEMYRRLSTDTDLSRLVRQCAPPPPLSSPEAKPL